MKGIGKAFARTPHLITSKVGMSKKSADPEFDDYAGRFASLESAAEKLIKDSKAFTEAVINLFTNAQTFSTHFATLFHPLVGESNILDRHPDSQHTVRNVDGYEVAMEELKTAIVPELELIETRIMGPIKEFQGIMKLIRKSLTKREHKLVDYDRFNNSLTKLRDKREKTLNDEKNLFKLEQDFEVASNEYEYINNAMKTDMPKFMVMATQFIDPLFHSFFYMQLNIFYLLLEKLNGFAEGKFEVSVPAAQIATDYEEKRTDAFARIEELAITKRIISTSKLVQSQRAGGGALGRSASSLTPSAASGSVRSPSFSKKAPPPPPSAMPAAPPPYSPPVGISSPNAAVTRKPPPPPPLKPKPKPIEYVVALYDFAAQADGDLEFHAGDRIEVVERTPSAEDWWTGKLNGRQGVFPGNYVQDA